ncbi:mitogen-activated protein kinase kinase kinase [Coemansia interrupta]|uniref:Mitogen-activated protein kinase kinase kinase n=1 Tax=Coemansia interrupta TaxID=1126814 RepID=A0A9W8H614_9FUNG|nr:mitogen-activated protein kinase kinase kinase [Coemansia interrupta]
MDGRSSKRDIVYDGVSTAAVGGAGAGPLYPPNLRFPGGGGGGHSEGQTFNLSSVSIPVDAAGNPLPWSRDSIVRWARQNGFSKFIPALVQNGIEGYRFYTLKLEEMREMRIPNVTMQDLIQLNAAIYRLNVSCASPANRSHMTGTLRTPTQGTQGTKSMHASGHPHSHSPQQTAQTLPPAPQQPGRPPRSAKAVSESTLATYPSAHMPTQQYALPAGSSQILARPLQPLRPPGPSWTMRRDSPQPTHVRPQVHLTSNGMVARPTPIPRPRDAPSAIDTTSNTTGVVGSGSAGASAGSGGSAYARATTYRSRDSAHVELDELHLVRPGQATWSAGQARQMAGQQQGQARRRSAVIEMFDEQAGERARVGRAPGRSAGSPTAVAVAAGLPARYHGTNQAHSAYYAHGASSVAGSGVVSPPSHGYRGTLPYRPPPPRPPAPPAPSATSATASGENRGSTMRVRRASLSPELTALLQPGGGYHIANLPDSSDSDASNASDSDEAPARRLQQKPPAINTVLPPMINTSLIPTNNTACDTGDSTITPLSVVNVVGGLRGTQQMRLAFGGDLDDLASASVSAESVDDVVEQSELSDLIGDAAEIDSTAEIRSLGSIDVWDAEEVGSDASNSEAGEAGARLDLFDAEEVGLGVLDAEEVGLCVFDAEELDGDDEDGRSSVHIDAYETASIADLAGETLDEPPAEPLVEAVSAMPQPQPPPPAPQQQQQQPQKKQQSPPAGESFRVKAVRPMVSHGADFDKTAATLLSSIKTDIERKAGSANPSRPGAASIAAAIERHQQRQQASHPPSKHTGRFSGLFNFGPRAPRNSGGLRVVTDFHSLRATGNPAPAESSSDGRKSASPGAPTKRWRVPFRQTPEEVSARRSRYRAGTTSDIESPQPGFLSDRPASMVDGLSSDSYVTATEHPSPRPLDKADSWTLMFFSKEFVVPPATTSTGETTLRESPAETVDTPEAPGPMQFTRGVRAEVMPGAPAKSVRGRPTADVIGDRLDEFFPGHDLDGPLEQPAPQPTAPPAAQPPPVARRKSVRMLVQETRQTRLAGRPAAQPHQPHQPHQQQQPQPLPPPVRRKSTKLWGCIPEEIHPPLRTDDIVRRALSLLRRPDADPQAERAVVEAALRCADPRALGSTRAHFVSERARQQPGVRGLQMITIRWIKGKLIGKGSFGHVYLAINAATGELIAVKQIKLPRDLCAADTAPGGATPAHAEDAIRMMYTEVELLKDLDHDNIVQLLGFEVANGVMSMFLEYVSGGTVQSLVQQHGPLPEPVVHSFVAQMLAGLEYLHGCGIVHRDIKGANILVDHAGVCKISDFGVSRRSTDPQAALKAIMQPGHADDSQAERPRPRIIGTVPFMAPEVVRRSQYTAAADIWSLGCVVVQMWAGRPPWDDLQEPQVFFRLGRGDAPPIPDDLTEQGIEFCGDCFKPEPRERWPAARLATLPFASVPRDYRYPYVPAAPSATPGE